MSPNRCGHLRFTAQENCHDAYAAAIAAEDVHTLRCLRRLGLPWAGDAATWRAHATRCGVPLLSWLHEEARVPVLEWMTSIGAARRGRRSEVLAMQGINQALLPCSSPVPRA